MKKLLILVEGYTEEKFVKTVLNPHFETLNIFAVPIVITTKLVKSGQNFKGGVPSYNKVKKQILKLLGDTNALYVTTMIDYYGLPDSFPGKTAMKGNSSYEKVIHLEQELFKDIEDSRFIPYYSLHEFEAMLFSSPKVIAETMIKDNTVNDLQKIKNSFPTPEDINDNPETCPSRRLMNLFDVYNKPIYGVLISQRIGINVIRKECPHFNNWISRFENF